MRAKSRFLVKMKMQNNSFANIIKRIYDNKKVLAVLVNLLVLFLMQIIFSISYETNDDLKISTFVNGARGVSDYHTIYQNVLLGGIYKIFYICLGNKISWYAVLQTAFLVISFSVLLYILWQKLDFFQANIIYAIAMTFIGYECYVKMQYSKVAGVLAVTGMLLLFYELEKEKLTYKQISCAALLVLTGFCYRYQEATACILFMLPVLVYRLCKITAFKKKAFKILSTLAITMLLCGVVFGIDKFCYEKNIEWQQYTNYRNAVTNLLDYGYPDYGSNEEKYKQIGITEDAYQLFKEWNFYDTKVFSYENIIKIADIPMKKASLKQAFKDYLGMYPLAFMHSFAFYGVLLSLLLAFLWTSIDIKKIISIVSMFIIYGLFYFYLFYKGRFMINRVEVAFYYSMMVSLFMLYEKNKAQISKQMCIIMCAAIAILGQISQKDNWKTQLRSEDNYKKEVRENFEELLLDESAIYFFKDSLRESILVYGPWNTMPKEFSNRIVTLGGWEAQNPLIKKSLLERKIENPYEDMIDKENVYIIDPDIERTISYIRSYYSLDAKYELVKTAGNMKVYKIISK